VRLVVEQLEYVEFMRTARVGRRWGVLGQGMKRLTKKSNQQYADSDLQSCGRNHLEKYNPFKVVIYVQTVCEQLMVEVSIIEHQ